MCNWICPHCNKSDHSGCNLGITTAMYFEPHYINGINVNPDRNISTFTIICHNCHRVYENTRGFNIIKNKFIRKQKKQKIFNLSGKPTREYVYE